MDYVMTHDELLAKIDEPDHWFKPFLDIRKALRAVVELHSADIGTPIDEPISVCDWCKVAYPCPTIKAIEKELM